MNIVTVNSFDRVKLFYPLVVHYAAQLIGFKELALRGIRATDSFKRLAARFPELTPHAVFDVEAIERALGAQPGAEDIPAELAQLRDLFGKIEGPLKLRSEYQGNAITIDTDEIAREVRDNHSFLFSHIMRSAGHVLILAHELCKDADWHDTGPLWEFLRHVRNAAAHGGTFHFLGDEPRRPACWGHLEIRRELQGTPLFKNRQGVGMLWPGDPIRLLWDLEQNYPHMSA